MVVQGLIGRIKIDESQGTLRSIPWSIPYLVTRYNDDQQRTGSARSSRKVTSGIDRRCHYPGSSRLPSPYGRMVRTMAAGGRQVVVTTSRRVSHKHSRSVP